MKAFEFNPETDFAKYSKLLASNLTFNNVVNESRCSLDGLKGTYQVSKQNVWLHDFLEKHLGMKVEYEFKLGTFTYDLRIGNILINYNPTMSHNVTKSYRFLKGHYDDTYQFDDLHHVKQSLNALQHGMFCIHVWEWDAWEPLIVIIKYLLSTEVFNAEQLKLIEMPIDAALLWSKDKCYSNYEPQVGNMSKAFALVDDNQTIYELMVFSYLSHHESVHDWHMDHMQFNVTRHVKVKRVINGTLALINAFEKSEIQSTYDTVYNMNNDHDSAVYAIDAVGWMLVMSHDCNKYLLDYNLPIYDEKLNEDGFSIDDINLVSHLGRFKAPKCMPEHINFMSTQCMSKNSNIDFIYDEDQDTMNAKFYNCATQFDDNKPNSFPYLLVIDAGQCYVMHGFGPNLLQVDNKIE